MIKLICILPLKTGRHVETLTKEFASSSEANTEFKRLSAMSRSVVTMIQGERIVKQTLMGVAR